MIGCARLSAPPAPPPAAASLDPPPSPPRLPAFTERVEAYLAIRRAAAARLPKPTDHETPARIAERRRALAAGIREARRAARPGDVFTAEISPYFRMAVGADLEQRSANERKAVLAEAPRATLQVNDRYPPDAPLATVPALLLARLPVLPEELQYRLLARDLLLLDCDAELVVDFIPSLLPGTGQ